MAEMRSKEEFFDPKVNPQEYFTEVCQLEVLIDIRDQLKRIADKLEPIIVEECK